MKPPEGTARSAPSPSELDRVVLVGRAPAGPPELQGELEREGYRTHQVARLDGVLPLLGDERLCAVIVGAHVFSANDLLLLRRVRERSPGTAVVVVGRAPTDPDLKQAFESGATAFLSWPSTPGALRQAVESVAPRGRK